MADTEQRYRLVVLGSGRVGKSSIVRRLLKDEFVETYKPTVEDLHCRDYHVGTSTIKVDILDTAGNLEFPAMRRLSISSAHAFLLVYSIDDRDSFDEIRQLWSQICEQRTGAHDLPCVIAGNKTDLDQSSASDRTSGSRLPRQVFADEVRQWAESTGVPQSALVEVSALDGGEISEIFYRLVAQQTDNQSVVLRRLEPLVRRRLSYNSARLSRHRAAGLSRDKDATGGNGTRSADQTEDCGVVDGDPSGSVKPVSRSRSLIRRGSKPKLKRSDCSNQRNDCSIS